MHKKPPYKVEDQTLHRCIAICVSQQRWLGTWKEILYSRGLSEDLYQELVTAGVEAWKQGLDPDSDYRAIRNIASRRLYRFLSIFGIKRGWDYVRKKQLPGLVAKEVLVDFLFDETEKEVKEK